MSSAEFTEWKAYNRISPLEPGRGDAQAALIASEVFNAQAGRKKREEIDSFRLVFDKPESTKKDVQIKMNQWLQIHRAQQAQQHEKVLMKPRGKAKDG